MVETALRHNLEEYAELMLFLLVAMTYINAMDERNVFEALRSWLIRKGFGYRAGGGIQQRPRPAAGVALMGQARGVYTFFGHLKWTPAIALGYAASIGVHMTLNRNLF